MLAADFLNRCPSCAAKLDGDAQVSIKCCPPCDDGDHATIEPDDNGIERCTCCGKAIAPSGSYCEVSVTRTTIYKVKLEDYDDPFDAILADDCEVLHEETLDVTTTVINPESL